MRRTFDASSPENEGNAIKHAPVKHSVVYGKNKIPLLNGSVQYDEPLISMDASLKNSLKPGESIDVGYDVLCHSMSSEILQRSGRTLKIALGRRSREITSSYCRYSHRIDLMWCGDTDTQRSLQRELHHANQDENLVQKYANRLRERWPSILYRPAVMAVAPLALKFAETTIQTDTSQLQFFENTDAQTLAIYGGILAFNGLFVAAFRTLITDFAGDRAATADQPPVFIKRAPSV